MPPSLRETGVTPLSGPILKTKTPGHNQLVQDAVKAACSLWLHSSSHCVSHVPLGMLLDILQFVSLGISEPPS